MYDLKVAPDRLKGSIEKLGYLEQSVQEGLIMFYGNSMFTRWRMEKHGNRPLAEDIRRKDGSLACVNHGFGTSTWEELLYYYPVLVRPWKPRALVLQEFGNSFGAGYSVEEMVFLFKRIAEYARTDMPGIRLYVTDVCPSPKKKTNSYFAMIRQWSEEMERYCEEHDDCKFIRHATYAPFFETPEDVGNYEKVRPGIHIADETHFNQAGYDLYRDFFRKELDDIL